MPKLAKDALPNELLRYERERRNWTQGHLAQEMELVGEGAKMVGRWERGIITPTPFYQRQLAANLDRTVQELGYPPEGTHPRIPFWHVPHRRNEFFTGQDEILLELHSTVIYRNQQYRSSDEKKPDPKTERLVLQPQALVGLGGKGKSQIAREYAYRYAHEYQTVFWLHASSSELLESDFADLATRLNLPEKTEKDPQKRIEAVKEWIMHFTRWLLIFDDANELHIIRDFLPRECFGHIIITTQSSVTGDLAKPIKVEKMPNYEAALLLLRQSKEIGLGVVDTQVLEEKFLPARQIAKLLGCLPLMLAQAGAFIERNPGSLTIYADLFQQQPREHLRYRDRLQEYPHPITKTFGLNFRKVSAASPVAADLLRLFAFLDPSAIPKELITEAALRLGPVLSPLAGKPEALRWAMMELTNYSLIEQSTEEDIYSIHPIVQLVIQNMMEEEEQRMWAERAVVGTHHVLVKPQVTVQYFHRHLLTALVCSHHIKQWSILLPEAAELLYALGIYFYDQAHYHRAELFLQQAISLFEVVVESTDDMLIYALTRLADACRRQGNLRDAWSWNVKALKYCASRECSPGCEMNCYLECAVLSAQKGDLEDAHRTFSAAVALSQSEFEFGCDLLFFQRQTDEFALQAARYGEEYDYAAGLLQILIELEKNPSVTQFISAFDLTKWYADLAYIYQQKGEPADKIEQLCKQALARLSEVAGLEDTLKHPNTEDIYWVMAMLYLKQGKIEKAIQLIEQQVAIIRSVYGSGGDYFVKSISNLAFLYGEAGMYKKAIPLCEEAISRETKLYGDSSPLVAWNYSYLSLLYKQEAEKALALIERLENTDEWVGNDLDEIIQSAEEAHIRAVSLAEKLENTDEWVGNDLREIVQLASIIEQTGIHGLCSAECVKNSQAASPDK